MSWFAKIPFFSGYGPLDKEAIEQCLASAEKAAQEERWEESAALFRRARETQERVAGAEAPTILRALSGEASALLALERSEEACQAAVRMLSLATPLWPDGNPNMKAVLRIAASALQQAGRFREAVPLRERLLAVCEHDERSDELLLLSRLHSDLGSFSLARSIAEECLRFQESRSPLQRSAVAPACNQLGVAYFREDNHRSALERFLQAFELSVEDRAQANPYRGVPMQGGDPLYAHNVARAYLGLGDLESSLLWLEIVERLACGDRLTQALLCCAKGEGHAARRSLAEARASLEQGLVLLKQAFPTWNYNVVRTKLALAGIEEDTGAPEKAAQLRNEVVESLAGRVFDHHPQLLKARGH